MRWRIREVYEALCTPEELKNTEKWYDDMMADGPGFETYEPDEVDMIIEVAQRIRDTGNAFDNFFVGVLKGPTKYTEAFAGQRPKASEVGDWLERDPDFLYRANGTYQERMNQFRDAYITQTKLRLKAEEKMDKVINSRLDEQDKMLNSKASLIMQIMDDENDNPMSA